MFNLLFSPASLQNTKGTIMDPEATTTFSPTVLHPHRLSLQQSLPTCWALGLEPLRDQATTLQMTKGTRTWSPTRKPPVPSRAYRVLSSRFQETHMGVGLVLLSPWPVTPATVLQCPTRARRWEKQPPGEENWGHGPCLGWTFAHVTSGDEPLQTNKTKKMCERRNSGNFYRENFLKLWTSFHKLMETDRRMGTQTGKSRRSKANVFPEHEISRSGSIWRSGSSPSPSWQLKSLLTLHAHINEKRQRGHVQFSSVFSPFKKKKAVLLSLWFLLTCPSAALVCFNSHHSPNCCTFLLIWNIFLHKARHQIKGSWLTDVHWLPLTHTSHAAPNLMHKTCSWS